MLVSECCGASAGIFEDYGICPDCREHCDWVDDEEDEDFEDLCPYCNGTGQGDTPDTRCPKCKGSGVGVPKGDPDY